MRLMRLFVTAAFAFTGGPLFAQPVDDCDGGNGSYITLDVNAPKYEPCGQAGINGYVETEQGQITSIQWDWGDGGKEASWFPAAHSYTSNGTYTVTITAVANEDNCQQKQQQLSLEITNAADETCNQPEPYSFDVRVLKSVDNPTPSGSQQTVEFTIEVSNVGESAATGIVVEDKLPPELAIPEGMAAFSSVGYYDPSSGQWEVGTVGPGLPPEVLTIPVIITTVPQPVCVLNTASSFMPADTNTSNDSSVSALRRPDIERCVDLSVKLSSWDHAKSPCEGSGPMWYSLEITNAGPDEAREVDLNISETLYQAPEFSIYKDDPNCNGLRCTWAVLGVGQSEIVDVFTEVFQVQAPTEHGLHAVISSDIEDYNPENNTLVDQRTLVPVSKEACEAGGADWDLSGVAGGGGCFIATATYGSASHPDVKILREFRDDVLLRTGWGRALIHFYYRHSPDLACYITEHDSARIFTRTILAFAVLVVTYPWQALLVLFAAVVLPVLVWRRTKA